MKHLDAAALAIVEDCLTVPAGPARDAVVETRTAGDAELGDRVRHLLSQDDGDLAPFTTQSFIAPAPGGSRSLPQRVGPFRIAGLIAEGGMGSVVRGERDDGVYAQTVAIKFLRSDLSNAQARARFDEERRILARLSHPSIAHVLDGGSQDGWPWLAMEYVDGEPLTDALDRADADLASRLEAFLAVCGAITFAHRNLVIHADIKPGNVFMRADGAIKLLDFGIARLLADTGTAAIPAMQPLTPGYASPERTDGSAPAIAGDIYSLGVLLRDIAGKYDEPDLIAIVAHSTNADPARRYPDTPALVADITAFRAHRPVAAREDAGWRYRTAKALRRQRLAISIISAIIAVLGIAAVASTVMYLRAERARVEAERRFLEVRDLSHFLLFDLYDDLADSPGTLPSRLRLADTARRHLEQLQRVPDAPVDLQLDIARGWRRLAAVEGLSGVSSLGRVERARQALDRAQAGTSALLARDPRNAGALEELGWIELGRWTLMGDNAQSTQTTARALAAFDRALQAEPGRKTALLGRLTAKRNAGYELIWANEPGRAIPELHAALNELRAQSFGTASRRDSLGLEVTMLGRLGDAVYYAGDVAGSLAWYHEQDRLIRAELARRPSIVWAEKLGEAKFNLSGVLMELPGRTGEALTEAETGIEALEQALAFGADTNLERRMAILYGQGALVLGQLGRTREAADMSEPRFRTANQSARPCARGSAEPAGRGGCRRQSRADSGGGRRNRASLRRGPHGPGGVDDAAPK